MKLNRYTYIVPFNEEKTIIFNGLSQDFIIVDNEELPSYMAIMKNPDKYTSSHPLIVSRLKNRGFILEDKIDPKIFLQYQRKHFVDAPVYKSVILPTFECNYKCWYCIQKHTPLKIDEEKLNLIVKHDKKYLIENNIKEYILSWFGGEPLTQPDIVVRISKEMKNFCEKHNIVFTGSVTTNGALLNADIIAKLNDCGINYYQIAIDGDEITHNRVKHDSLSESSFALIMGNINNVAQTNKDASITLRVNYTIEILRNKRIVDDVLKYIPVEIRKQIIVDLQRVWQISENLVPMEDLIWLQNAFASNGFYLESSHIFAICYVEKKHYNMFYYNGGVEKCDKRTPDTLRGYINEDGDVVWKEKPIFPDYDLFAKDCVCSDCDYYPLCLSGCPVEREDGITNNPDKKLVCGFGGDYSILERRIRDYCWRIYHNLKYKLVKNSIR